MDGCMDAWMRGWVGGWVMGGWMDIFACGCPPSPGVDAGIFFYFVLCIFHLLWKLISQTNGNFS